MRKFTTEHTVYEFDELSKDAQEKAIENYREGLDFPWLTDDIANRLEELLKENKITYDELPKIYYSLSYCQGDGAMFEGTIYWKAWTITAKQSGHYYHYNSKELSIYSTKTGKDAPDDVYDKFNDVYVSISKELEKYGYDVMETALSDENMIDIIQANEYEFYADGSIA